MARLHLSLVAAVLLIAGAQAVVKDKCQWAVGKHPFDSEKMVGTWYVISCATNHPEKETKYCAKYELSYVKSNNDEKFDVKFSALDKDRKTLSFQGISKPYKTDRLSMFLGVMRKTSTDKYSEVEKQAIIATDYDNYAVFLSCRSTFDDAKNDFGRIYRAAVLSRKPTLSEDIKKTLVNILSGYDIDASEFKTMEHTDCPE